MEAEDWCTKQALCHCHPLVCVCDSTFGLKGRDAFLGPESLPGALFGVGPFSRCFVSLTSAAFGADNDHTFPKLGCDVNIPRILPLGLMRSGSPKYRLRWRPFLSVISGNHIHFKGLNQNQWSISSSEFLTSFSPQCFY